MEEPVTPLKYAVFTRSEPRRESKMSLGPFRATQIWNEIVTFLKLTVEVKRRRYKMRYIDSCFTGADAVSVVLQYLQQDQGRFGMQICRENAVKLCKTLMDRSIFGPVSSRMSEGKRPSFEDSHSKLYQFVEVEALTGGESDHAMEDSDDEDTQSFIPEECRNTQELEPDLLRSQGETMLCKHGRQPRSIEDVFEFRKEFSESNISSPSNSLHKCIRRFCHPDGIKFGDNPGEIQPAAYDEIWKEVALRQLLTLIDVPILDGLLDDDSHKTCRKTSRFNSFGHNNAHPHLPLNGSAVHQDPWVNTALQLLEGLQLPASGNKDWHFPVTDATKKDLFKAVQKHYCQCFDPLLPEKFIDLYLPILNLVLQEKDEIALKALQLLMILLPWQTIDEVHRLFKFMAAVSQDNNCIIEPQEDNKIVVIKMFTCVLIRHPMISDNLAGVLVGFMLTNSESVFMIPKDVEDKVNYYMCQVKQGRLEPVIGTCLPTLKKESYCARLSLEEHLKQSEEATSQGLREMIDRILDDTKIPLKEKKIRLKQFQKFHPEICAKYFPDIV